MGYLVCKKCNGYYKLKTHEKIEDFSDECPCGGKLEYRETLDSSTSLNSNDIAKLSSDETAKPNSNDTTNLSSDETAKPNSNDSAKNDAAKPDKTLKLPKNYMEKSDNRVLGTIDFKKDLIVAIISVVAIYLLLPPIGTISFVLVALPAGFVLSHWLKPKGTDSLINLVVLGILFTLGYAFTGLFSFHKMMSLFLLICLIFGVVFFILSFIGMAINQILNGRNT